MNQKRLGIIISYINLALGTIINIFLTPYIIAALGDESYSLYKVMQSFAGPLIMFNLGLSAIVTRAIVRYDSSEETDSIEKNNTVAMALIASIIMAAFVGIIGIVLCLFIPNIYGGSYSAELVRDGQQLFLVFVLSIVFTILTEVFNGCATGHEKYAFFPIMSLLKHLLRMPLIIIALSNGFGAKSLAIIDSLVAFLVFIISLTNALFLLKERPKFHYFSKTVFLEMLSFSAAILMQAIINQVNNNVDMVLLGAMIDEKWIITMYSSALLIFTTYNSLVCVLSNFFLPKATRLVSNNATGKELTDFVIGPGRFQAMMAMAIMVGFAVFGKEFITLWIGEQYKNAYYIVLILMIPATVPLVEDSALAILDATLKRLFRSIVLVIMAVINVCISVGLIKLFGYWGACAGTFISLCVGHIVLMNIYYHRTFDMNIWRMFKEIFAGILPVAVGTGIICMPIAFLNVHGLFWFVLKCMAFSIIYVVLLWRFALNCYEKDIIKKMIRRTR